MAAMHLADALIFIFYGFLQLVPSLFHASWDAQLCFMANVY